MNCDSAINNSVKNNSFFKTKESAKHVSLSITYRTFSSYIYIYIHFNSVQSQKTTTLKNM